MQIRALSIKKIKAAKDNDDSFDASNHIDYGVIDPYNLNENSQLFLSSLTKDIHVGKLFAPGRYIGKSDTKETFSFELVKASIGVTRNKHGLVSCVMYDNTKKPLDQTSKARLFAVEGKLVYRFDKQAGFRFEKDDGKRVIKETRSNEVYTHKEQLNKEYHLSKDLPHVGARQPLILQGRSYPVTAASSQKKKSGANLADFMPTQATFPIQQGQSQYKLNTLDCIDIVLELFEQAEVQLTDLVHRDLKPENMMLEKHAVEGWMIHIIDYETSRKIDKPDNKPLGTPLYVACEVYNGITSPASDICSLGMTACYILHDSDLVKQYLAESMKEMQEYRQKNNWRKNFDKLLKKNLTAPDQVRDIIVSLLRKCTDPDPLLRPTIQTCITEMQLAHLQYQQITGIIPADSHKLTEQAMLVAQKIRTAQSTEKDLSFAMIIQNIKDAALAFKEDEHAMRIFSRTLRQYCVRGMSNHETLIEKLEHITENFVAANQVIAELHTKLSEVLEIRKDKVGLDDEITIKLTEQIASLSAFQVTIAKTPVWNFDALLAATEHMISKSMKEEESLNAYQKSVEDLRRSRPGCP